MINPILVKLAAATDAVFEPCRHQDTKQDLVKHELRFEFRDVGIPFTSGGSGSDRVAQMRSINLLEHDGLVARFGNTRGFSCRVTELGDELVRQHIGILFTFTESLAALDFIYESESHPEAAKWNGESWIPETLLADHPWGDEDRVPFFIATVELFPCLWRGLVTSNSSMQGHVWYRLTAEGREMAQQRAIEQCQPAASHGEQESKEAEMIYVSELHEQRTRLSGQTPRTGCIGPIPLPVSLCRNCDS